MLKQRLIVGIIGGLFAILVLCLDVKIVSLCLALVSLIGLSEIYNATGMLKKQNRLCIFGYVFCAITYIAAAFSTNSPFAVAVMVFMYGFVLLLYMIFNHETCDFTSVCEIFFQTLYVVVLFCHIIFVRKLRYGNFIMWMIFITAWLSDTMAYFIGIRFGRNKLIPQISPKKTVEGALGGLLGSVLFNLIFGVVCSAGFNLSVNYFALICLALIAGVFSQLGDLAASCIKREYGIKDFSNLLPGHGGVLDRFDSVLFVAPVVYYFAVIFSVIA
jgi:phosphatidate cytidylyltransferase